MTGCVDIVDCLSGSELRMVPEYVSQSSHDIPELFDEFSFHYIFLVLINVNVIKKFSSSQSKQNVQES